MKIKSSDKSSVDLDDYTHDSSGKRRYRMTCKSCNLDRRYQRPAKRKLACRSCGQIGKSSSRIGVSLSDDTKQRISDGSTRWRSEQDPNYRKLNDNDKRLIKNIRCRLWQAVRNNPESLSKSLGCKTYELRGYIESQFEDWMSWDNYGTEWEIDHVKPLSSYDLTDPEQFKEACHYTNLQPMSITDNRSKGTNYEDE